MRSTERGWAGEITEVGSHRALAFLSAALTEKRAVWGGDALERGHGAPLERTAQLGDALSGVGAVAILIDAAELVAGQAATGRRRSECQWALTQAIAQGAVTHSSEVTVLPLSPSQSFAMPSAV